DTLPKAIAFTDGRSTKATAPSAPRTYGERTGSSRNVAPQASQPKVRITSLGGRRRTIAGAATAPRRPPAAVIANIPPRAADDAPDSRAATRITRPMELKTRPMPSSQSKSDRKKG